MQLPGLYHKLHGITRPVTMKKSTIKRRKRVVPANQEHYPDQSNQPSYTTSVSPEPLSAANMEIASHHPEYPSTNPFDNSINLGLRPREPPDEPLLFEPTPIDFTGYHVSRQPPSPHQTNHQLPPLEIELHPLNAYHPPMLYPPSLHNPPSPQLHPQDNRRKRSFSVADGTRTRTPDLPPDDLRYHSNRLSSISSILNPTSQTAVHDDPLIDPSLTSAKPLHPRPVPIPQTHVNARPSLPPTPEYQSTRRGYEDPGGGTAAEREREKEKAVKKERLRREAEEMREKLRAKERELEELDDDGFDDGNGEA